MAIKTEILEFLDGLKRNFNFFFVFIYSFVNPNNDKSWFGRFLSENYSLRTCDLDYFHGVPNFVFSIK